MNSMLEYTRRNLIELAQKRAEAAKGAENVRLLDVADAAIELKWASFTYDDLQDLLMEVNEDYTLMKLNSGAYENEI